MNVRNEKLKRLISGVTMGLGCMAVAGVLFWGAPMEVKAVPLSSTTNANNTVTGDNTDGDSAGNEENVSDPASGGTVTSVTVNSGTVNVRSDASTSANKVGTASNGTEMTVTGEKADSSGMTWYAVTYESNGSTVSGYIRSDLVEVHVTEPVVTEPEVPSEEQPADTPEEPVVTNDYFVQYEDDGTGSGVNAWYLYDNTMGNKYKIDSLLNAEATNQSNAELMEQQTGKLKMIIVAMAVVILILIIVLTVLILKLRNSSYDDDDYDDDDEDEDEEDEEDEEEEETPRKRRFGFGGRREREEDEEEEDEEDDEEEEEEYRPRRKAPVSRPVKEKPVRRTKYEEDEEDEEEEEEYRPRRSAKPAKSGDKNWQSKNFLDDDDLEFEFLDLK